MSQKLKHVIFILAVFICCGSVLQAKTPTTKKKGNVKSTAVAKKKSKKSSSKRVRREVQEDPQLMADKVTIKRELQVVDSLMLVEEIEGEEILFPADELYGSWVTNRVNPYEEKTAMPDSFTFDLSTFIIPVEGRVTSPFGPRRRRMHYGTDLKVEVGDTIRAAFDGKVRVKYYQRRGYGYYMVLRHPNGLETVYGHLSKFLVDSEDIVKAGQPIALGGNTGRSTGPHLHFEMRFLGQPINPAEMIDFENFVAHTDSYTFHKNKSNNIKAVENNKYTKGVVAYHRVKRGDTLYSIAKRYGLTIQQLCKINNIKPKSNLKVGSSLRCS